MDFSYSYDGVGNITAVLDRTRSESLAYTYDPLDRLLGASGAFTETYAYNTIGNMTSKAGLTYNYTDTLHRHAVTALSDGSMYQYDRNGNMTQRLEAGVAYTQTWDSDNRLTNVAKGNSTTQYFYDADGTLVRKVEPRGQTVYANGDYQVFYPSIVTVTIPSTFTHKLYLPMIANSTPPVNLAPARVTYRFNGQQVAVREGVTLTFVHGDHLGSASLTTDISGAKVSELRYKPFGETRWQSGTMPTDRTFTGQRSETASAVGSLMDFWARFYSPLMGRFISADSIVPQPGDPQSLNRYAYARNSPLNYVDPTGHSTECAGGDNNCWVNNWVWNNRWYEAHGHFWDQGTHAWSKSGDARLSDMGILRETLSEAGIQLASRWLGAAEWALPEASLVGQGVIALADKVGSMTTLFNLLGAETTWFVRYYDNPLAAAMVGLGQVSDWIKNTVEFFSGAFSGGDNFAKGTAVHELAHVIDYHSSRLGVENGKTWTGILSPWIPDRRTRDISNYGQKGQWVLWLVSTLLKR